MIERQERNIARDGALFVLGFVGILVVEFTGFLGSVGSGGGMVHGFIFGIATGIMLSGVFRATREQALYSTIALGVGFALGAVVNFF